MKDVFLLIVVIIGSLVIILLLFNYFSGKEDITWISGDEPPKPLPKPNFTPVNSSVKKENDSWFIVIFGFLILTFFIYISVDSKKKINNFTDNSDLMIPESTSFDASTAVDTTAALAAADSSYGVLNNSNFKYTSEDIKNKLKEYFDIINNRQFYNIHSYFAPIVQTYFPYKNVSNEFASNDVINFWSNQKQPSRIYYDNSNFEVTEYSDSYVIKGNLFEQSSLYSERIPYWLESEIVYIFNRDLKLTSLSGNILKKQPDLVRIFEIEDASINDIKERENKNDFKKYFNLLYKTFDVKPSVAKRYIQAINEVYGSQLLIFYRNNYYSFEEFTSNKSMLYSAYLYGVKSVDKGINGTKIVSVYD